MASTIIGFGHYAPERRVPNAELETLLKLDPGWIEVRTGIRERRWAADSEALSDMASKAGEMALTHAGIEREKVVLTLLATSTPDHLLPPSAPLVTHKLKLANSGAVDMAGACAGFLYALSVADAFVRVHDAPVLVIAANILSRRIDLGDRGSAVLFADAAGAVLLAPSGTPSTGVLGVKLASDGSGYDLIKIEGGGSAMPFAEGLTVADTRMRIADGRAVFAGAVDMMVATSEAALAASGVDVADVKHWIPHQANTRIIEATRRRLGIGEGKVLSTVETFGNSSAASIPFTLSMLRDVNMVAPGDLMLMTAAGAGLTGGSVVYRM